MTKIQMEIHEMVDRFSEIVELTNQGADVVITENDVPKVRLVPVTSVPSTQPRIPGLHRGAYTIRDDFDEPLSDEFWLGQS